jgi:hypothetical protein
MVAAICPRPQNVIQLSLSLSQLYPVCRQARELFWIDTGGGMEPGTVLSKADRAQHASATVH